MRGVVTLLTVFVCLLLAASAFGPLHWSLDLLAQFHPLIMLLALGALGVAALLRLWRACGALLFGLGLSLAIQLPSLGPVLAPHGTPLARIIHANVWYQNASADAFLAYVRAKDPDIITTIETHAGWHKRLLAERPLPFALNGAPDPAQPLVQPGQSLVLSRWPLTLLASERDQGLGFGFLAVRIDAPTPFTLVSIHLTRPWPFDAPQAQLRQLDEALAVIGRLPGPLVVTGDFNAVPRGRVMQRFSAGADLRLAVGVSGTWMDHHLPAAPVWMRLPIDHVLASRDLALSGRRIGPHIGSDHRPVLVEVSYTSHSSPK